MKLYKKSDLSLTNNGLLVSKDGDIVLPDIKIVNQANELDLLAQQSEYLASQPEATPMPSLDGFERMSIKDGVKGYFHVKTPTLDQKFDEAMAIMDEIDGQNKAEHANRMLDAFVDFIEFVASDSVIDCGNELYCFDTPMIGNVLELTKDDVIEIIATINDFDGVRKNEDEAHVMAVPATEENLNKIKEFFNGLSVSDFNDEDTTEESVSDSDDEDTTEE